MLGGVYEELSFIPPDAVKTPNSVKVPAASNVPGTVTLSQSLIFQDLTAVAAPIISTAPVVNA